MPMAHGRFLAWLLPCIGACIPPSFDKGLPCHSAFSVVVRREAFLPPPPRQTGGVRQVFNGWLALL